MGGDTKQMGVWGCMGVIFQFEFTILRNVVKFSHLRDWQARVGQDELYSSHLGQPVEHLFMFETAQKSAYVSSNCDKSTPMVCKL